MNLEAFYYREARLLDERQYQQWFALLAPEIEYTVPARHVPQLDNSTRETEAFLNRAQEFSKGMEPPLRDEKHLHLMIRVMRSLKMAAWTENPPARTRRHVGNIELVETQGERFTVYSNTLLYYSRHEAQDALYSYQRRDVLQAKDASFVIVKREVLLDNGLMPAPGAGLFF